MDQDLLMLSGIQHYAFCPRQWALIHVEQQWKENVRTVDGNIFHHRAHHGDAEESRGDLLIVRSLRLSSEKLGIIGICDIVEFHRCEKGVRLTKHEGRWVPYPVEYKKGEPKEFNADRLQLCAQAMCLEEMLSCSVAEGALFYGEPRRREKVVFTDDLRGEVARVAQAMHDCMKRGYTPVPHRTKACNACSLNDICIPAMERTMSVKEYIKKKTEEPE